MTKRFTLRAATIGIAMSGLLAVAACGGDDDSSDTTERPAATTTEPSDSATTTADDTDTTAGGGSAADCAELGQEFATALASAANPTGDADEIDDAFDRLGANVPADLQDDVQLVGEALGKYADLYAKFADDPTKAATDPDVLDALQELSAPEYQSATQAISAYFTSGCQTG